jgi:mannitol-1-phosphate/altronate dehydrogenase
LLYDRFKAFDGATDKGLIFFACELIDKNGDMLKKYVLQHAQNWNLGDEFTNWVNESCAFCNTLVDRIVPGFPKDEIAKFRKSLDLKTTWWWWANIFIFGSSKLRNGFRKNSLPKKPGWT